jgi:hypothetical protein
VDLTDLVGAARVVEDPLGGRRLSGIDVRHDADVAGLVERELTGHEMDAWGLLGRRSENEKRARSGPRTYVVLVCAEPYVVEVSIAC